MGVEYSAKIVVGLPVDEMEQDNEGYWDEDGVLEFVADGYDSPSGVVGLVLKRSGTYSYSAFDPAELPDAATTAKKAFKELCGKDANVYLCTCGF